MRNDAIIRRLTITSGQVAAKFGVSETTLRKRLPRLLEAGFPRRIPGSSHWSGPAVDAWFASAGLPAPIEPVKIEAIVEATNALEREYAEAS